MLLAFLGALLLAAPAHAASELVLRLEPGTSRADADRIATGLGGTVVDAIPQLDAFLVSGVRPGRSRLFVGRQGVLSVEPNVADRLAAGPPYRGSDWHLEATRVPEVWALTQGDPSVTVAILDTGVDLGRPELATSLVAGIDIANDDDDPTDHNGHGTFVAGLVASTGFVNGVCPGCTVMPVKVVGDHATEAPKFDSAEGIVWAVDHGAEVVNLSFGGGDRSEVQEDAVRYALARGVIVLAAAGNESSAAPQYPAAYDGVVAVGASDDRDRLWSGSSYGPWVDLAAPGKFIFSLALEGGFERRSGTSFATPIVSGLAALVLSAHPSLAGSDVATALRSGTVPLLEPGPRLERGRVDATLAFAKAAMAGQPTLSVTRFALSPQAPFVRSYGEARAGRTFAAGAVVVRDDTGGQVTAAELFCAAHIGSRALPVMSARFAAGAALCAWRVPWSGGERWIEGSITVSRNGFQAIQRFRVKAKKPLPRNEAA